MKMAGRGPALLLLAATVAAQSWPRGRHAHCAVTYGHYMIVYGGSGYSVCRGVRTQVQLSDVWAFDLNKLSWQALDVPTIRCEQTPDNGVIEKAIFRNPSPGQRAEHSCATEREPSTAGAPGSVLIFGGGYTLPESLNNDRQYMNDVWRLELQGGQDGIALTANWVQPVVLGPRPLARGGHVSVVIDSRMHVFGGCLGWGVDSSFDDLWDLLPAEDGAYEWNRVIAPPSTVGNATSSSDNAGAPSSSNTTEAPSWPGQRCWHVGTPHPEGMLISGGRAPFDTISMGSEFDGQEAVRWRSLADVWIFRPEQRLTNGSVSWPAQWVPVPQQIPTSGASIHRSHHAGVFTRGELLLFGGLWTDVNYVTSYTTYIVRDFLRVPIPSIAELLSPDPSPPTLTVLMSRGPIWVYDHTMVLAGESAQSLANSPIIFGGKGESGSPGINIGMGIFDSVWIYSLEEARWEHINPYGDALAGAASFVSSLLFGTVGFILYTCVIVCVFMRKLVRARRDFQSPSLWMESPEAGAMRPRRAETRGIPQAAIDALPRHKWGELQSAYEAPRGTTVGGAHGAESASAVVDASPGVESPSKASGPGSRTAAAPSKRSNGSVESIELASKGRSEAPAVTIVRALAVGKEEVATRLAEAAAVECTSADADSVASGDEDAELCSVCLCAYDEEDMLIRLPCAHIFHEACISRWLHQDSSCPQCRHLVSSNTQLASPPSAADWQAAHDARRMAARRRSNDVEAAVVVVPAAAVPVAHSAPMSS